MPERFSPAQPNYLRFVSTPTIDIEPNNNKPNGSSASTNGQALQKPTANGQASQTPAGAAGGQRVHVLSEALAQQLASVEAEKEADRDGKEA